MRTLLKVVSLSIAELQVISHATDPQLYVAGTHLELDISRQCCRHRCSRFFSARVRPTAWGIQLDRLMPVVILQCSLRPHAFELLVGTALLAVADRAFTITVAGSVRYRLCIRVSSLRHQSRLCWYEARRLLLARIISSPGREPSGQLIESF